MKLLEKGPGIGYDVETWLLETQQDVEDIRASDWMMFPPPDNLRVGLAVFRYVEHDRITQ